MQVVGWQHSLGTQSESAEQARSAGTGVIGAGAHDERKTEPRMTTTINRCMLFNLFTSFLAFHARLEYISFYIMGSSYTISRNFYKAADNHRWIRKRADR
jgi:hypothetical protein